MRRFGGSGSTIEAEASSWEKDSEKPVKVGETDNRATSLVSEQNRERRRHPRFVSLSHATIVGEQGLTGYCLVQDLSLTGAQILGTMQLVVGERITLGIHLPRREPISLPGRVVRRLNPSTSKGWDQNTFAYGISFARMTRVARQTLQHQAWQPDTEGLERAESSDIILVVDGSTQACAYLVRELGKLGRRAIAVTNALDAIEWLLDDGQTFCAALINVTQEPTDGLALLTYLAESYPEVQRLTMAAEDDTAGVPARVVQAISTGPAVSAASLTPLLKRSVKET